MSIPDFQSIMLPLLKIANDGKIHTLRKASESLAEKFGLNESEMSILISSGQPKFYNRVGWARTYLKKAGLIKYPQRGSFQITKRGLEVLEKDVEKINISYLERFPEFIEFRKRSQPEEQGETQEQEEELTPEEALENAYQKIRSDLADELLEHVLNSSSEFFEKLVVELLVAMGYGGTQRNAARAVGKSGDEGIDGIIDEDRLGLDVIYIQAKRWKRDAKIGRPQIHAFVGALHGKHARKGVFITTADFMSDAVEFIKDIESKIVLINGERLASLMIDFGVGVSTKTEYRIKELDSDYFEEIINE